MNNKYGLPRTIPEPVKRLVRQNSGFGCVICGTAICEYEHIDPEWVDASEHNAEHMTLLCASCHSKKTRGIYSKEKIKEAMKNPKCKTNGFTFDYLDFGKLPLIYFGKTLFYSTKIIIEIDGSSILSFNQPNQPDAPFTLNAVFHDYDEKPILSIEDNIWYGNHENWDIECVGTRISIRQRRGDFSLILNNIPREKLVIEKIKMKFKQYEIIGDINNILVKTPSKDKLFEVNFGGEIFGDVALKIEAEKVLIQQSTIKNAELTLRNTLATDTIFENCGITIMGTDGGLFKNCHISFLKPINLVVKKNANPIYRDVKKFFNSSMLFNECYFNYLGHGTIESAIIITDEFEEEPNLHYQLTGKIIGQWPNSNKGMILISGTVSNQSEKPIVPNYYNLEVKINDKWYRLTSVIIPLGTKFDGQGNSAPFKNAWEKDLQQIKNAVTSSKPANGHLMFEANIPRDELMKIIKFRLICTDIHSENHKIEF